MTVQLRTPFFRDMTPGHWMIDSRRFEGKHCLHLQGYRGPDSWTLEDAATTFLRNVENQLPNDAASVPTKRSPAIISQFYPIRPGKLWDIYGP
jgi:hypothetical protein